MTGPDPAVAAVRVAVRRVLQGVDRDVLVACSGGADSLALVSAAVFEARRASFRVIGATVDHGLQEGSAAHADHVVAQMAELGVDETATVRVTVDPGPRGVEAGAREARYAALGQLAAHVGAGTVLLGHTLDDQAETVLLGLTRGSGGRSIAGMRRAFRRDGVMFARPLLDLGRADTESACRAEGIGWWEDPHNTDPRFVRSRIRHTVLPVLERELGPGVAAALARTADAVRTDVDELDDLAEDWLDRRPGPLDVGALDELGDAVRLRVLRLAAVAAGAIPGELARSHVLAVDELVRGYRGQRWVDLPGHVRARRAGDRLRFEPGGPEGTGADAVAG
ncbi:MAG TPA: tRNA lysidine(34) synthetase TilS [Marmoricola sp.]|nr:tRNA lysidine(34) synthetase TilS [Marmoricola sp.]